MSVEIQMRDGTFVQWARGYTPTDYIEVGTDGELFYEVVSDDDPDERYQFVIARGHWITASTTGEIVG